MAAETDDTTDKKQISIAVQQGQKRRIMKGMTYDIEEKHGYLYLVRTREFKSLNRPIYKVGRTSQCPDTRITRLHKYTKGSEIYLILQCHVEDVSLIEKDILERFCHQWDPGPDGSEDFIIPTARELMDAKQIIMEVVRRYEERRIAALWWKEVVRRYEERRIAALWWKEVVRRYEERRVTPLI